MNQSSIPLVKNTELDNIFDSSEAPEANDIDHLLDKQPGVFNTLSKENEKKLLSSEVFQMSFGPNGIFPQSSPMKNQKSNILKNEGDEKSHKYIAFDQSFGPSLSMNEQSKFIPKTGTKLNEGTNLNTQPEEFNFNQLEVSQKQNLFQRGSSTKTDSSKKPKKYHDDDYDREKRYRGSKSKSNSKHSKRNKKKRKSQSKTTSKENYQSRNDHNSPKKDFLQPHNDNKSSRKKRFFSHEIKEELNTKPTYDDTRQIKKIRSHEWESMSKEKTQE